MANYAKFVKEMHWPELSQDKRNQMTEMKKLLSNRNKPIMQRYKEGIKQQQQTLDPSNTTGMMSH